MEDVINKYIKILCLCVILDVFSRGACFEGVPGSDDVGTGPIVGHSSRTRRHVAAHRTDARREKRHIAAQIFYHGRTTPSNKIGNVKIAPGGFRLPIPAEGSREQLLNLLKSRKHNLGHHQGKSNHHGHPDIDAHTDAEVDIDAHAGVKHHKRKERFDPCKQVKCLNKGICKRHHNSVSGFHCACALGFRGNTCNQRLSGCQDCPKKHDCTIHPDGVFCLCTSGSPCLVHVSNMTDFERILSVVPRSSVYKGRTLVSGILMVCLFTVLCIGIHCVRVCVTWCKQRDRYVAQHVPPSYGTDCLEISDRFCVDMLCCCCCYCRERRPQYHQQSTADIKRLKDVLTGKHASFDDYFDHFEDGSPPVKGSVEGNNTMHSNDASFQTYECSAGSVASSATSASSEKHVTWSPMVGSTRRLMSNYGGGRVYGTTGRRDSNRVTDYRNDYQMLQPRYETPQAGYEIPQPRRARSSISPSKRLDFSDLRKTSTVIDERGQNNAGKFSKRQNDSPGRNSVAYLSTKFRNRTPCREFRKARDSFSLIRSGTRKRVRGKIPGFESVFTPIKFIKDKLEKLSEGKTDEDESLFEESFEDGYNYENQVSPDRLSQSPLSSVEAPREDEMKVNEQVSTDNDSPPFRGLQTYLPPRGVNMSSPRNDHSENNGPVSELYITSDPYDEINEPVLSEESGYSGNLPEEETDSEFPAPPPSEDLKFEEQSNISNNRYFSEIPNTRRTVSRSVSRRIKGTAKAKHDSPVSRQGKSFLNKSFNAEDYKKSKCVDTCGKVNEVSSPYRKHNDGRVYDGNDAKLEAQQTPGDECFQIDRWPSCLVKATAEKKPSRPNMCSPGTYLSYKQQIKRKSILTKKSVGVDTKVMASLVSPVTRRNHCIPSGRVSKVREKGNWNRYKDKINIHSQNDQRHRTNSAVIPELIPKYRRQHHRNDPLISPVSPDHKSPQGGLGCLAKELETVTGQSRVQDWVNDNWDTIRWSNRSGNNNEVAEAQSKHLDTEVTRKSSPRLTHCSSIERNLRIADASMNKYEGNACLIEYHGADTERVVCDDRNKSKNNILNKSNDSLNKSEKEFVSRRPLFESTPIQINHNNISLQFTHDSGTNIDCDKSDHFRENTCCTPSRECPSIQKQTMTTPPIELITDLANIDESTNVLTALELVSKQYNVSGQAIACLGKETLNMSELVVSNEQDLDSKEIPLSQSVSNTFTEYKSSEGNGVTENNTEHDVDDIMICVDKCWNESDKNGDECPSKLQSVDKNAYDDFNIADNLFRAGEEIAFSEENNTSSDFSEVDDEIFIRRKSGVGIDDKLQENITENLTDTYPNVDDDNNTSMEPIGTSNSEQQNPDEIIDEGFDTENVHENLDIACANEYLEATDVNTNSANYPPIIFDADAGTYNDNGSLQEAVQNMDSSPIMDIELPCAKTPTYVNVNLMQCDGALGAQVNSSNDDLATTYDMSAEVLDPDSAVGTTQNTAFTYDSCGIVSSVEPSADTAEHAGALSDEDDTSYGKSEDVTSNMDMSEDSYTTGVSSLTSDTDNETVIGFDD